MKLELKIHLPTGEEVFFTLDEAKQLYVTLKDLFEPLALAKTLVQTPVTR